MSYENYSESSIFHYLCFGVFKRATSRILVLKSVLTFPLVQTQEKMEKNCTNAWIII